MNAFTCGEEFIKKHNKLKEVNNCSCSKSSCHLKYLSKLLPQKVHFKKLFL